MILSVDGPRSRFVSTWKIRAEVAVGLSIKHVADYPGRKAVLLHLLFDAHVIVSENVLDHRRGDGMLAGEFPIAGAVTKAIGHIVPAIIPTQIGQAIVPSVAIRVAGLMVARRSFTDVGQ